MDIHDQDLAWGQDNAQKSPGIAASLRETPSLIYISPLLKLRTHTLRTKFKCLIRTDGVLCHLALPLLQRAPLIIPWGSTQRHLFRGAFLDYHPIKPIPSPTLLLSL